MNRPLILLLLAYLVLAAAYAVRTPAWLSPDEPAHYNYIAQVAAAGCCPLIQPGDWDQAYLAALTGSDFAPASLDRFDTIQYEDHQPPLYYLLASPIFRLSGGSLTMLRLFSVLIGAGVVATAFFVARAMLPARLEVALGTAGVVAFIPQHLHILASVNNDGLAELVVGLTLWALIRYIKNPLNSQNFSRQSDTSLHQLPLYRDPLGLRAVRGRGVGVRGSDTPNSPHVTPWMLGILVGVGLLTKASTIFLAGLVPLFIVLRLWLDSRAALRSSPLPAPLSYGEGAGVRLSASSSAPNAIQMFSNIDQKSLRHVLPRAILHLTLFAIPALLLAAVWWIRNFGVYGFPDFLGLRAHDAVVVGQPRTADLIASVGFGDYLRQLAETTFHSFWGKFGWMELTMPTWAYLLIGALLLLSLLGWTLYAFARLRPSSRLSAFYTPLSYGEGAGVRSIHPPTADPVAPPVSSSQSLASPPPDPVATGVSHSQSLAWAVLVLTASLAIAQFVYYNTEFQQFQGRYIYPGLIPFALILTLGITVLAQPLVRRIPLRSPILAYLAPLILLLPLIALTIFTLWRLLPSLDSF